MSNKLSTDEKDELSEKRVFSLYHSDIPKGITQCEMGKHQFVKHSENEIFCPLCQSIYIIDSKKMKNYGF
jgi:hypothetical protein